MGVGAGAGGECEVSDDRFEMLTDKNNRRKVLSDVRNEKYSKVF